MGFIVLVLLAPLSILVSEGLPWWFVAIDLLVVLGVVVWAGSSGWKDEGNVCLAALISYGGFFAFHFIDSAMGDGGWSPLEERNILLVLWAFVAFVGHGLAARSREQEVSGG